jgi:hypothetical protein
MEILEICLEKWFSEDICNIFMSRQILHVYCLPLHHVYNIVILYFNVFRSIMKHMFLREIYTTLVITMNSSRIHLMIEQVSQKFAKPQ